MVREILKGFAAITAVALSLISSQTWASAGSKTWAFVNPQLIITSELATSHTFVLNFINMSDFVMVSQPNEFIYKASSGRFYIGQVYELEHKDPRGEAQRYSASVLLKGHSSSGLTIVGAFHEQGQMEELSVRIGSKRFYLKPLDKVSFEQLAKKIGNLDLDSSNPAAALQEANIPEMGTVKNTDGTSEWDRDWEDMLAQDGVNPPKIIERPEISLPDEARKSRSYGKIKLSGVINKNGGIQDLKVARGLDRKLDQRVLDAVINSWVFLPATKNGEVLETAISFDVEFPALNKQP